MVTHIRSFEIHGPEGLGAKPRPELIGPLYTHLRDTLQDAVRMGFLHSSRSTGRVPGFLKAATDVRIEGVAGTGDNITTIRFRVPSFGTAAADLFQQKLLWDDGPKPNETAFELFGAALNDVANRKLDSNRFDPGLLRRISSFGHLMKVGIDKIRLPDTELQKLSEVNRSVVSTASELSQLTPKSRRVRIAGRLDLMGASQTLLKLEVKPGVVVTALWQGKAQMDALKDFFNRDVVLEGTGVFRPSGTLLRIDADAIERAEKQDDFFRMLPEAVPNQDYQKLARLKPGQPSAYARLFGSIPAEESDDEFLAAIEKFS